MDTSKENIASRVSILDSKELDDEIFGILKTQFSAISSTLPPGALSRYEPEIEAIMKLYVWKISVGKNLATFGQQLLSLKFSNNSSPLNLWIYGLCSIGTAYVKERIHLMSLFIKDPKLVSMVQTTQDYMDISFKVLNIISFLIFLRKGYASTIIEKLLHLNTVSVAKGSRNVGYAYMTRELIWHGFIEMLAFIIPLINYHALKRRLRQMVFRSNNRKELGSDACLILPNSKCSICQEVPVIPHQMGCPHVFCYYCLSANRLADAKFECPDCAFSDPDPGVFKPVVISEFDS